MNTIPLVIRREYLTRVRKPSFWLLTILVPILLAIVYAIPVYMALRPIDKTVVLVVDESGLFSQQPTANSQWPMANCHFSSSDEIEYRYAASLDYALRQLNSQSDHSSQAPLEPESPSGQSNTQTFNHSNIQAILYIRSRASEAIPTDACLYFKRDLPPQQVRTDVDRQLQRILRNRLLQAHGISDDEYALITGTKINLRTQDLETGREAFTEVKTALGLILAMLIYIAIFMFGSQVMRGVVEEKTNRIVEVIVCSVKPFHLMMGKVVGIALVGLTQFLLWVFLTGIAVVGIQASNSELFSNATTKHQITELATKGNDATLQMQQASDLADVPQLVEGIAAIDFSVILPMFLFFFVFGYLLYATLFAAAGAMSDTDTDTSLFSLPLTIPLLAVLLLMPAMLEAPSGILSQVLSIIPFTSPVAMMLRIPFGVPIWQIVLSVSLLIATIPLCTWLAARIYRSSILRFNILRKKNK